METSRVLVTYSDSPGVYPSIAENLRQRLPLRKLNWNSTSRPFRSIPSLHIELVRDHASTKAPRPTTGDWAINADEPKEGESSQGRRHQIPGLRQSPYLKIYFLKCDDVDTYRATTRKDVREWISGHTPESQKSSSTSKKDNHDAFEWLIVQVVPSSAEGSSTPGASSNGKEEGSSKRSTLSRLSSRGSTMTVNEKVRSDFNGTSKNAVDRVVQITVEGDKAGWDDMVAKMKSLILASFDLRVTQYEEDIKEKEMQRNLPGWNFNTFFVLKEGLARGFESVGLIEDALTGYHELATGLDTFVEGQTNENAAEKAAAPFNEYTEELLEEYRKSKEAVGDSSQADLQDCADFGSMILDTSRKDFRHLILANNISIFDFQCYVFARQTALLLRLANAGSKKLDLANGHTEADASAGAGLAKPSDDEPVNLLVLAETCQLASNFVASTAAKMREDIQTSLQKLKDGDNGDTSSSEDAQEYIIANLISSWTISVSENVLEATSSQTVSTQLRPLLGRLLPEKEFGSETTQKVIFVPRKDTRLPDRSSSLTGASKLKTPTKEKFPSIATPDALRLLPPGTPHTGAPELAAQRGDLFVLSRRALNNSGYRISGWQGGLSIAIGEMRNHDLEDVDLDHVSNEDDAHRSNSLSETRKPTTRGVRNKNLASALQSESSFYEAFKDLTGIALANYVVGGRTNAAEGMTADLAVVRFNLKDYTTAAAYFDQLAGFYGKTDWMRLEVSMLDMHAQCLKYLGRTEDYIKIALKALAIQKHRLDLSSSTTCSLADIITTSKSLKQPINVPLDDHFDSIYLDPYLRHFDVHDGFQMLLKFRSCLPSPFRADSIRIKIASVDKDQAGEHWLSVKGLLDVAPGACEVLANTNEMHPGWYSLAGIYIQAQNIVFELDRSSKSKSSFFSAGRDSGSFAKSDTVESRFLIWARSQHLDTQLSHFEAIDLRRPKSIKVTIFSGWNEISHGKLSMKAASAGLRLDTAEARGVKPESSHGGVASDNSHQRRDSKIISVNTKKDQPGTAFFGQVSKGDTLAIQVPYSLENDLNEITVKLQVAYTTDIGEFVYSSNCKLNVTLPVSVNVQDIFKQGALFPKFTIGSATSTPLRLTSCSIEGNSNYEATSPIMASEPVNIFARQPFSFVSRIHRRKGSNGRAPQLSKIFQRLLHLQIQYRCMGEEIYAELEASLLAALQAASLQDTSRLVQDQLRTSLHTRRLHGDMETVCLLGELPKGAFEEYSWDTITGGLSPADGEKLEQALKAWHTETPTLLLETGRPQLSQMQYLTVPFDLPSTHVVHTVRLQPLHYHAVAGIGSRSLAVDQPLPMQLDISYTRQWDADLRPEAADSVLDFHYEVLASPDTWLIGGQRKAKFSAKEAETHTFAVLLLPQTTGRLLYPSVEITPISTSKNLGDDQDSGEDSPLSCETDYLNQSETILVVPNLASTTVSLDPANGGWLVESRSREA